jgi:GT2 family glycosyltransferase
VKLLRRLAARDHGDLAPHFNERPLGALLSDQSTQPPVSSATVSIIVIHKGRPAHLARLLEGVERSSTHPLELIVVDMAPANATPLQASYSQASYVKKVALPSDGLPLAHARNVGRHYAQGDILIFLDVDCIPSADLVKALPPFVAVSKGLVCCEVLYLRDDVSDSWTEPDLTDAAIPHPLRSFPETGVTEAPQPGLFWSLAFGVRADVFDRINGFDEAFSGYGAEDTDFAFRAAKAGIPILFAAAGRAFHQYHGVYNPPLHHCADIVRNANLFRQRHGLWPMEGWLDDFERMGLIDWTDDEITLVRTPTTLEIEASRAAPDRAF